MASKGKRNETPELHRGPIRLSAEDSSQGHVSNQDEIRRRAYEIHLERGGLSGGELADWLQAEAELRKGKKQEA